MQISSKNGIMSYSINEFTKSMYVYFTMDVLWRSIDYIKSRKPNLVAYPT
jgi:hypothetical protein